MRMALAHFVSVCVCMAIEMTVYGFVQYRCIYWRRGGRTRTRVCVIFSVYMYAHIDRLREKEEGLGWGVNRGVSK